MIIFPAIDLRGGQVVRLTEGDYGRMDVFDANPEFVAQSFRRQGATHLHMVDLDGARDGSQQNIRIIGRIARQGGLFIQVGGGARDEHGVKRYLDLGVDRVIVGTMAVERPELLDKLAAKYPGRIAVGVDARGGKLAIRGWRELTDIDAFEFMRALPARGIDTAVYTDISKDGMMQGPNLDAYRQLREVAGLNVVASGGVSTEDDVRALRDIGQHAAIIGKAIYLGSIDLGRAIQIAEGKE